MPKRRLGVVLLLPPEVAAEVDGLRRGLGDGALGRIPPHITLVPPVNVREDRVDSAVDVLRTAAGATRPFRVALGPPATFLPVNPTLYLSVGEGDAAVRRLRDAVFTPPLERALTYPFIAHVTIGDGADPARIGQALVALADYSASALIDSVHLLEEGPDRVWEVVASVPFRPPSIIGRGGLPLELQVGPALDPAGRAFFDEAWAAYGREVDGPERPDPVPLAITGRRDGRVVCVATGEVLGEGAYLGTLITDASVRGEGVGAAVLAAFESEAAARGATLLTLRTRAGGPAAAFYRRHGWREVHALPSWRLGHDFVKMERRLVP